MTDEIYMREALRIAKNAEGRTSPNPLVGAVVVKDEKLLQKVGTVKRERLMPKFTR